MIKSKVIYILFLFFAFALFMANAWVPGFFHDGYLYAAFGKHAAELNYWLVPHLSPETYARFDQHSPFIFILEGMLFKVIGSGFFQARLFVAIFAVGCFVLLQKLIKFIYQDEKERDEVAIWTFLFFLLSLPFLKIVRFPNMDVPLTFFILGSLYFYLRERWILMGIFFGLSLLTKGPMAVFIPLAVLFHLCWQREWKKFLSLKLWSAGFVGIAMFSLWPMALFLTGQFEIFRGYIQHTFFYTMKSARGEIQNDYFLYLRHLAIFCGLHLLAIFAGVRKWKREGVGYWGAFLFSAMLAILLPTSLMKFKYSHYIAPIFPFLAIMAGVGAREWIRISYERLSKIALAILSIAVLAINLNPKGRIPSRDFEIFQALDVIHAQKWEMGDWYLVDEVYPFWSLANLLGYVEYKNVKNISHQELNQNILHKKGAVIVLPMSLEHLVTDTKLKIISRFPSKNLLIVMSI